MSKLPSRKPLSILHYPTYLLLLSQSSITYRVTLPGVDVATHQQSHTCVWLVTCS
jgi:hypothetical protein